MPSVETRYEVEQFPPIRSVEIFNFKSIRQIKLECKRVNVFIGEPNSGKSNIIEAVVGLPSLYYYGRFGSNLKLFVRFDKYSNVFYDNNLEDDVRVRFEGASNFEIQIYFRNGGYIWKVKPDLTPEIVFPSSPSYSGYKFDEISKRFKFYRFRQVDRFDRRESEYLLPPDGRNLPSVYITHKSIKRIFGEVLRRYGLKLMREPDSNEIKIVKETEADLIAYPYQTVSDTLQRLLFYLAVILTNKESVIAMEEPEAHSFPYYTKYLAEIIASDNDNQYFITTHNPYFLQSLIEKTHKDEIAVFLTYYRDYQTKVKPLSDDELREVLDLGIDVFFNIERFLEE